MFLMPILRSTKIINISTQNNVDLYTLAGSPSYLVSMLCFINGNIGAPSNITPVFTTNSAWVSGSYIYIKINASIIGGNGTKRMSGAVTNGYGGTGDGGPCTGAGAISRSWVATDTSGSVGSQGPAITGYSKYKVYQYWHN